MKQLISILLVFACSFSVKGQDTFYKLIYLEFPATRFSSVLPTDSCYYVTGTFTDSISPVRAGVLFTKLDLYGEVLTLSTIKHPDMMFFNDYCDLGVNPYGQIFFVGSVNDEPGSNNAIIYLYDENGDTIQTKKFNSILYPEFDFVLPQASVNKENGDYAVLSEHDADANPQDIDISLLVIDSSLGIKNYKRYGISTRHELANSLVLDDDGGYIIGAERTNDGLVWLNYDNRTLLIKTDSTGEQEWQWLSPVGVLQDAAKAMIKTPDGGLIVASGLGQEIGNNPNGHTLVWDGLIFKLDADRNVVWSTPFRGDLPNGGTKFTEMVEATDGNGYVASGIVYEKEGTALGHYTSWLVKVSPDGDSLWSRRYTYFDGEFVAPEVWDMKVTPDGGYVLVGIAKNVFDIVTNPIIPAWIMKVDSFGCLIPGCHLPNATGEEEGAAPSLVIYPNPVGDLLNFQLQGVPFTKDTVFRIVNMDGKVVKEINGINVQATVTVPVAGWPSGAYFLQCLDGGAVLCSEKFIKQ